jgi:diadenosine tetraphosphate (Ap4A) HIT family hydrolase
MSNPSNNVITQNDFKILIETVEHYSQKEMQEYIQNESKKPSKQWIYNIILGKQEKKEVLIETDDYILLPDTEKKNKYTTEKYANTKSKRKHKQYSIFRDKDMPYICPDCELITEPNSKLNYVNGKKTQKCIVCNWYYSMNIQTSGYVEHTKVDRAPTSCVINWLVILKDRALRTIRDLDGSHVPILKALQIECVQKVHEKTGIDPANVVMYIHYHPSVYQLHVHVVFPFTQLSTRNLYRMHFLDNVIENLTVNGNFYKETSLQVLASEQSALLRLLQ